MNFQNRARAFRHPPPKKTLVPADTINAAEFQSERKTFHFELQENSRGQFLRITEVAKDRSNSIVIPASGLAEFKRILDRLG